MGYASQAIGLTGTWVPAYTGFSADPSTLTARYTLIGKWCMVSLVSGTDGTSNATTFTITLPFAAANTATQIITGGRVKDNGTIQPDTGLIRTQVNTNIADIFKTLAVGAFTASGNKNLQGNFLYEIA